MRGTVEKILPNRVAWFEDLAVPLLLCFICVIIRYVSTYIAFHFVAETCSIVLALAIYIVVLSSNVLTQNTFILIVSSGFAWAGIIDIFHVMTFKGMFLFSNLSPNIGVTFWLGARLLQASSLVLGVFFIHQKLGVYKIQMGFLLYTSAWVIATLYGLFPTAYDDKAGLTAFKIGTEVFTMMLLFSGIFELNKQRNLLDKTCFRYLVLGLLFLILAESLFCLYYNVSDLSNLLGHLCKILSYWFVFRALVVVALENPFHQLSRTVSSYELIPFPAVLVDKNSDVVQANTAACHFLKRECEAIAGHSLHTLFHSKDVDKFACEACHPIFAAVSMSCIDIAISDEQWLESSASLLAEQNGDTLWLVIMRDISHRKALEKEKHILLNELSHKVAELALINRIRSLVFTRNLDVESFIKQAISFIPLSFAKPDDVYIELKSDFGDFVYPEIPPAAMDCIADEALMFEEKIYGHVKIFGRKTTIFVQDKDKLLERLGVFVNQLGLGLQNLIYQADKLLISRFYELLLKVSSTQAKFESEQEMYEHYYVLFSRETHFKAVILANVVAENKLRIDIDHGLALDERHVI